MGGAVSDLHCRLLYRFIHIISIKTLVIMDTQKRRVLVLNPNSSKAMTEGMVKAIGEVQLPSTVEIGTYTAPPEAPSSINDDNDIEASTNAVVTSLAKGAADFNQYDAMLVACYSVHPLVQKLSHAFPRAAVTGIFEASILTAQLLLRPHSDENGASSLRGPSGTPISARRQVVPGHRRPTSELCWRLHHWLECR